MGIQFIEGKKGVNPRGEEGIEKPIVFAFLYFIFIFFPVTGEYSVQNDAKYK